MTDKELRALLADMTLEEKLGEMTQLSPNFFGAEESVDLTGPMQQMNLKSEDVPQMCIRDRPLQRASSKISLNTFSLPFMAGPCTYFLCPLIFLPRGA